MLNFSDDALAGTVAPATRTTDVAAMRRSKVEVTIVASSDVDRRSARAWALAFFYAPGGRTRDELDHTGWKKYVRWSRRML
jgi:hypothetical protein